MNSDAAGNLNAVTRDAKMLSPDDFSFFGYKDPRRFFKSGGKPYRILPGSPDLQLLRNVVYVPARRSFSPFDGCLYDDARVRLDASCIARGSQDKLYNTNPKRINVSAQSLPVYSGSVIYLGYINKHYGHFLIESLARAWAVLGNTGESRTLLFHLHNESVLELPFVKACFQALGFKRENILFFKTPTLISEVVFPHAAFQLDSHAYEAYREVTSRIAASLHRSKVTMSDQPLYLSRRLLTAGVKKYDGETELEDFLQGRGVKIMHPQQFTLAEQVKSFNSHRLILGITGSAMHNLVFAKAPVSTIQFSGATIPPTYFLIDSCFDIDSTYVYSTRGAELQNIAAGGLGRRLEPWTRKFPLKLFLRSKKFRGAERLDSARVIAWIKSVGVL